MKATVFLGGGRITSALIAGLRLAKYNRPIIVHDRHLKKVQQLRRLYNVAIEVDLQRAVEAARLLFIAVRPASVHGLLREIGTIGSPLNVVSLAAGIPLLQLKAGLGSPVRWARAMPSPVCRTRQGLSALAFGRDFPKSARVEVKNLFALVGPVLEIPERQFDAFTVTYSSSHGYHALASLIKAAEAIGLDRKSAQKAAAHALADGIATWRAGNLPLEVLVREAATPGGIAAAVTASLDENGYHRVIARALRAGIRQARKNSMPMRRPTTNKSQ